MNNLDAIAKVDGIDALFIGPADLAASLGYGANQGHEDMRAIVIDTIKRIKALGKPAGLLTGDTVLQRSAMNAGINFMAIGVDAGLLARGSEALLNSLQ